MLSLDVHGCTIRFGRQFGHLVMAKKSIKPIHSALKAAGEGLWSIEGHKSLYLKVSSTGGRSWLYRSRVGGVLRWANVGNANVMAFDEASRRAQVIREQGRSARGKDNPIEVARAEERARKESERRARLLVEARQRQREQEEALRPTLDKFAEQYIGVYVAEKRRANGDKRWKAYEQAVYDREISPRLGAFKVGDIKTRDVASMRNEIKSESGKRKAVAVLRALLSHAKSDGLVDANAAIGVKVTPSGQRAHVLTADECKAIWSAHAVEGERDPDDKTAVEGIRATMLAAIKVQLATGQRAGEVLAMRWSDLKEQNGERWWVVPAEIAKNGKEHLVPLAPQVWALIDAQLPAPDADPEKASVYVFPAWAKKTRAKPVTTSNYAHVIAKVQSELKLKHFTSHDLRRTCATRMAEAGTLPHVIEAVLNHSSGVISGVAGVYNRSTYFKEKRDALRKWAKTLDSLASGQGSGVGVKIVDIATARAKA